MIFMKYYCEKCGSEDIKIELVNPQFVERRQSIAEFNGISQYEAQTTNQMSFKTTLICKSCGNSKGAFSTY